MMRINFKQFRLGLALVALSVFWVGCSTEASSSGKYWGQIDVPEENKMRYITGSEPESMDPQFVTGQPEARIMIGLYDRLVEYHPKTMQPIPSMATKWEVSEDGTNYTFHIREGAVFSNGDPITAEDFAWSFRRALSPELASRYAFLGYDIKYAEAYNSAKSFVNRDGKFLLAKDLEDEPDKEKDLIEPDKEEEIVKPVKEDTIAEEKPVVLRKETILDNVPGEVDVKSAPKGDIVADDQKNQTEFQKYINSPERLTVPGDPFNLAQFIETKPQLKKVFSFSADDIKDAGKFVSAVRSGGNGISKYLAEKIDRSVLDACADGCDGAGKQKLAAELNKIIMGDPLYTAGRVDPENLPKGSQDVIAAFNDENKKITEGNQAIDEKIAGLTDAQEKAAEAKKKKEPLKKLFYLDRYLLEDIYSESLAASPVVPIEGKDLGVEADNEKGIFRVTLKQSAPYFTGLLTHQFFAVLHRPTLEKENWGDPANAPDIVVSGAYKIKEWKPYDELTIEKNPKYWDAENVTIEEIVFYPMDEQTTMMNIYKSGRVDALYNHTVPAAWNEYIRQFQDEYLLHPEMSIEYYTFSVKKPPVDKVEVRKAFSLAIDRGALEKYRKTIKKLVNFTPEGIFPEYEEARKEVYARLLKENGISEEEWNKRMFDPARACELMEKAGYTVEKRDNGKCNVKDFPADDMTISYNTAESNKQVAEFVQAQWKQNLGITVQIKNMEWKTYLSYRSAIEYTGAARAGWVGDFVDPYTFLSQFYTKNNDSSTGWWDPKYDKMLEEANNIRDPKKRFEKLAEAEFYMMQDQPVAPLSTAGTSWMKKPYVKGMYPNPGTMHPWKFVYIERDPSKWDANVDDIMQETDSRVEQQIDALVKTQKDFEASQKSAEKDTDPAAAEE